MGKNVDELKWVEVEKAFEASRKQVHGMIGSSLSSDSPIWRNALTMIRDDWNDGKLGEACRESVALNGDPYFSVEAAITATVANTFYYCLSMALGIGTVPEQVRDILGSELADAIMNTLRKDASKVMFGE